MKMRGFFALAIWAFAVGLAGPSFGEVLAPDILRAVYPDAQTIGPFQGTPSAAAVTRDGKLTGYVLSTADVIKSTGYGGEPIDVIVGVSTNGIIQGAYLYEHNEPILVIGITNEDLRAFVDAFAGTNVLASSAERIRRHAGRADAISGATISSAVIRDAVIRGARTVLRARTASADQPRLAMRPYAVMSWPALLQGNEIAARQTTFAEVPAELGYGRDPGAPFIELFTTVLTPPRIGGNLIGKREHDALISSLATGDHAILIAANGYYSFKGRSYRKSGVFDRIQIAQGSRTIPLRAETYSNLERVKAEDAPELREIAVFVLDAETGFDPTSPWRLDLFVHGATGEDAGHRHVISLGYDLPPSYVVRPAQSAPAIGPEAPPLWQDIWRSRQLDIAGVVTLLTLLTVVLVFQDRLVRYRQFRDTGRLAFLAVVLVWLGWYAGGQLSVLQVVTFGHALLQDFKWEHFLVDPVIFLLWGFVAITLLFWGRGVYCGWLCPFGAMQELLNTAARRLGVPQVQVPFAVHERLWAIKYVIFLGLFAVSLHTVREAMLLAEVEPFKTAISLAFVRHWPFVLYAAVLLTAGLFIERFFCRYLCPLGAALAIPARLRMFNWLRRRHQCGRECQICSERCTVQAIHPTGEINPNECIYCLECQTYYMDDHICPPLVATRKKRERRLALASGQAVDMKGVHRE
ncbi:MAG: regulatory protein NosR [Rhodospirillales bacterium]|nr:regulatory protein NosR [Rhodospirillales bacterium]MBO6785553.1 regulatory protein NosR [Rhodospirillales bacterium]